MPYQVSFLPALLFVVGGEGAQGGAELRAVAQGDEAAVVVAAVRVLL